MTFMKNIRREDKVIRDNKFIYDSSSQNHEEAKMLRTPRTASLEKRVHGVPPKSTLSVKELSILTCHQRLGSERPQGPCPNH
ncbi:Hypothetical protein PHPALM_13781 [Phytophthora palmivora]|uniref:Uncharacterized protein n=1 Tax=Phytophthora palmivora TaxID=4796 RepID=A0A2P4XWG2_9STRA|nr:Hypothetical protein PHPALM_13781 [Phytophthora palmivora]